MAVKIQNLFDLNPLFNLLIYLKTRKTRSFSCFFPADCFKSGIHSCDTCSGIAVLINSYAQTAVTEISSFSMLPAELSSSGDVLEYCVIDEALQQMSIQLKQHSIGVL